MSGAGDHRAHVDLNLRDFMRITILQGPFLPVPPLRGGACEKLWYKLGIEFARCGHEVTSVSRRFPDLPNDETTNGVRYLRVRSYDSSKRMLLNYFKDFLYNLNVRRVLPDADILITNTLLAPIIHRTPSTGALYVNVARYPKGQMKYYSKAARLQAPSTPVAAAIREQVPHMSDRVTAIPNPLPWVSDVELSTDGREKVILFLGRIHPEKGLRLLIEGFAGLAPEVRGAWRVEVRGPWRIDQGGAGAAYLEELKTVAAPLGGAVSFHDPLFGDDELKRELRRASLFVYPSLAERGETFGVSVIEAMSCGCPPLVSGLECFRDFLTDDHDGFVFDHRADSAVEALKARLGPLLQAPDSFLQEIGANGIKTARAYEVDRVATRYLDDFASILGHSRSPDA